MSFWKDFWLGKEVTETFNVGEAVATITSEDGEVFTVTRIGKMRFSVLSDKPYVVTGQAFLEDYLSEKKLSILVSDDGRMIPTCRIKTINIVINDDFVRETWR